MDSSIETRSQLVPVGDGFALLASKGMSQEEAYHLTLRWKDIFPGVPIAVIPDCRYVAIGDDRGFLEFMGDKITPEVVSEIRAWWKERNEGIAQGGTVRESSGRPPGH